jgi:hypothetical protein
VLSPEEEFAVTRGLHGHPELEGYGVTEREERGAAVPAPGAVVGSAPAAEPPEGGS